MSKTISNASNFAGAIWHPGYIQNPDSRRNSVFAPSCSEVKQQCANCVWPNDYEYCPLDPENRAGECPPGEVQANDYQCVDCEPGTHTDNKGLTMCSKCSRQTYADSSGSSSCDSCPTGSEAWSTGTTTVEGCRCTEGYYTDSIALNYVSQGCYASPVNLNLVQTINEMTLDTCNW